MRKSKRKRRRKWRGKEKCNFMSYYATEMMIMMTFIVLVMVELVSDEQADIIIIACYTLLCSILL